MRCFSFIATYTTVYSTLRSNVAFLAFLMSPIHLARRFYVAPVYRANISRCRNHNKIRIAICCLCIQRCGQVQFLLCKILFDIVILNRGLTVIDHVYLLRDNIHSNHLMMLGKQGRN